VSRGRGTSKPSPKNEGLYPCSIIYNLSRLEQKVKVIFEKTSSTITEEERTILFKWLLKIFGGLWLKTSTLKLNISKKDSSTIIPRDYLKNFSLIYSLIKTIRYDVFFTNFKPYSLFLFDIDFNDEEMPFMFLDNLNYPTILFAYKKIGAILAFGEGGEVRNHFTRMNKIEFSKINQIGLLENFCRVLTAYSLMNKNKYGYLNIRSVVSEELRIAKFIFPGKEKLETLKPWDKEIFRNLVVTYMKKIGLTVSFDDMDGVIFYGKI